MPINPYPHYSDEWFLYEFPEYVKAHTRAEWLRLFIQTQPEATKDMVARAVDQCVRIYGVRDEEENEFGEVCP